MAKKIERWIESKPGCNGCKYVGTDLPCEYILITGKSPQSQGAHIDPEGDGGCELYDEGAKIYLNSNGIAIEPATKIDYKKVSELYKKGMTDAQIAKEVGCIKGTVRKWRAKNNLKPNLQVGMKSKIDSDKAMEHYKLGKNDHEIANAVGVNADAVYYWRKIHKLPANHIQGSLKKPKSEKKKPKKKLPLTEKVVRCADCKHWWKSVELCKHENCCDGCVAVVKAPPEHFCSYGERKDGNGKDKNS